MVWNLINQINFYEKQDSYIYFLDEYYLAFNDITNKLFDVENKNELWWKRC